MVIHPLFVSPSGRMLGFAFLPSANYNGPVCLLYGAIHFNNVDFELVLSRGSMTHLLHLAALITTI